MASGASPRKSRSTRARCSSRATRSCAAPGATTARSRAASRRCCVGKQMQFFGARANLAKCLLYAINGGRDEISGEAGRAGVRARQGRRARLRRRARQVRADDGLARGRLRQRDERHPLHARQVRLRAHRDGAARLRAAAHDGLRHGRPVGRRRQPVGDQAREGQRRARRHGPRHRLQDRRRRSRSSATTTTASTSSRSGWSARS